MTDQPDTAVPAVLTRDDLPTLHRLASFLDERARHRGRVGAAVCRAQAMVCRRLATAVERYRMLWPAETLDAAGRITQSRAGR